jgi:hypothetical protein
MPRYPIREARGCSTRCWWRPRQRRWLEADLERVVNRVRVQVGEHAQAVAGELLPRRAEPRSDGWTSSPGAGPAEAGAEPPDRSGRRPGEARRARTGLDDPPSEVRGLIERHEQLRELEDEDPVRTPRTSPADMPSGMAPHVVWEIIEGQSAQRVAIEDSWEG